MHTCPMTSRTSLAITCRRNNPSDPKADDLAWATASSSRLSGSSSPPDAAGRTYPPKWVAPEEPPIDACGPGRNSASGTACMPTSCNCYVRPTNSIPTPSSSTASTSVPSAAANRPAPAPWTAEKRQQAHAVGGQAWRAVGHSHRRRQRQRSQADHPAGLGLSHNRRQAGATQGVARCVVCRRRLGP